MTKPIFAAVFLLLASCSSPAKSQAKPNSGDTGSTPATALPSLFLSSASATAAVGTTVTLTAQAARGVNEPIEDGTLISFQLTGSAGVLASSVAPTAGGAATASLTGIAPGPVTVVAGFQAWHSNSVTIRYTPTATPPVPPTSAKTAGWQTALVTEIGNGRAMVRVRATDSHGNGVTGATITLYASAGTFPSSTVVTGGDGWATTFLYVAAALCPLTVTATALPGTLLEIESDPGYADLVLERMGTDVLGVEGSGRAEFVNFKVRLVRPDGTLYPLPTRVNFRIEPAWMASLVESTICCAGEAVVTVRSGRAAGTATLWAEAPSLGLVRSLAFEVKGGLPDAQSFNLSASTRTVSGLRKSGLHVDLFASATDRWGNPVLADSPLFVACESGVCLSPQPGATDAFGRVTFTLDATPNDRLARFSGQATAQFPLPFAHRWPLLGDRRNGNLTVLAGTIGEGSFLDRDGNGSYSPGDTIAYDPPEPFLDVNDNGTYDPNELYWDYDGDHLWSSHAVPAYHPRQYVWSSFTVILSGRPAVYLVPSRFLDCDGDQAYTPGTDYFVVGSAGSGNYPCAEFPAAASKTTTDIFVYFGDENGNPLPAGSKLTVELSPSSGVPLVANSLQTAGYDGSETDPHPPARFRLSDDNPSVARPMLSTFCAQVILGDTQEKFVHCIDGYAY